MQDSIELPDTEQKNIHFMVSPQSQKFSPKKYISNAGSQESLAYSNSTFQKDYLNYCSPQIVNLPSFQIQSRKNSQQALNKPVRDINEQLDPNNYLIELTSSNNKINRNNLSERKTIDKNQYLKIMRKSKQLQYALHLETITSEQLRTKLTISTQMLHQKVKDLGLNEFFNLKNSSKQLKNIDVFIEMKAMRKQMNQKDVTIQKLKAEIKVFINKLENSKAKSQQNSSMDQQFKQLLEQKQSLFNYIEEMKVQYKVKQHHYKEIQTQNFRLIEKDAVMERQRAKLFQQIQQKFEENSKLQQNLMIERMENNLLRATEQQQSNKTPENSFHKNREKTSTKKFITTDKQIQTTFLTQIEILKAQTNLLKVQRDYYLQQYRKKIQEGAQLYQLRKKLSKP